MVDGFDNKATLFCYVDFVFVSFFAIWKISFCFGTPCTVGIIYSLYTNIFVLGACTNHVDRILGIFDLPPPYVDTFTK